MFKRSFLCIIFCLALVGTVAYSEETIYYNPDGGQYYHAKAECATMRSEYYPLMQPIVVSQLESAPYSSLKRCVHCFENEEPAWQPESGTMYFRHKSSYATAPDGFFLSKAGEYLVGEDFPAGVYTIHGDVFTQGKIVIFQPDGNPLHSFLLSGENSASFYLAEGMRLSLPDGLTMWNMTHTARFQFVMEMTDISSARYFMMLECPGREYCVQSKPGMVGYAEIYSMDAELGQTEPVRYSLSETEPTIIDLSGLYNYFVELHDCLIWFTDPGVG